MTEKTILLVEDNPDDEALTLRAFKKAKISNKIDIVRDGAEALDYLFARNAYKNRNPNDLPQVVLLDLKLPKIDGIDVLKTIREDERLRLVPVVILTSSREDKDLLACYGNGANSYICKPVNLERFIQAVENLGVYWLVLNESLTSL